MDSACIELDPTYFGVEHYFAAKSLIASRSFEIDDHHGFGMVPLADLFNHKTGAEDVHFTSISSHFGNSDYACDTMKYETDNNDSGDTLNKEFLSPESHSGGRDVCSSTMVDSPAVLEMIIVKDVKAGAEVFNTYGSLGNAALLHRYGFTEADNPYDIVNIDLELVVQWSLSLFSARHSRSRLSLWRRLDYCGCESQESEYFEIASDGEPQVELLILLYLILAPEKVYQKLYLEVPTAGSVEKCKSVGTLSNKEAILLGEVSESSKDFLLTKSVRRALLSLADIRESSYGCRSVEDDVEALKRSCHVRERKFYHSLILRISERRILEKLRSYASAGGRSLRSLKRATLRNKLNWR